MNRPGRFVGADSIYPPCDPRPDVSYGSRLSQSSSNRLPLVSIAGMRAVVVGCLAGARSGWHYYWQGNGAVTHC